MTCDATHCVDAQGNTIPLDVLPAFALGSSHANAGSFSSSAAISEPLTSANHTNIGSLSSPGGGPAMSSSRFVNQGGFIQ